ncbi:efflux RND transporter periplasmic adaptor subunit [Vibrio sp. 10N.286.49.B1]|uniref:efflux RND transporter periplasmic adaptor subunit n=1 Tax=unclassified Vibrio TaxID=2614977 RepID=UPI000C82A6EA
MNRMNLITLSMVSTLVLTGCHHPQVAANAPTHKKTLQVVQLKDSLEHSAKHFNGVVRSQEKANLTFRVPGTISTIHVRTGQLVAQGDPIAQLDPHDYQVALEELQAKMLEAKSAHKLAKAELRRVKQATEDNAIASVNLDRATSGYERSLSAIKVVEKNIQRAKDVLHYTQLTAPFDGVIGKVNFEQHEQALPGVAVVTLHNTDQLEVEIDVPENMIQRFELGEQGTVSWHHSSEPVNARITEIAPLPHLIKQTYTVTYAIDDASNENNNHKKLFPGKSVSVTSTLTNIDEAHCVPYSAIVGEKETLHINVVRNKTVVTTPVELRSLDAYQACITGPIYRDDFVVVSGSSYLHDGDIADQLIMRKQ